MKILRTLIFPFPRTLKFPLLNPNQEDFLLRLCESYEKNSLKLFGKPFFFDEGKYHGDPWTVINPDGQIIPFLHITFPEFKELDDKGMLAVGEEGWHRSYGNGIRRKSFEFYLSGLAFDYYIWKTSVWWKKIIIWLYISIKEIFEVIIDVAKFFKK